VASALFNTGRHFAVRRLNGGACYDAQSVFYDTRRSLLPLRHRLCARSCSVLVNYGIETSPALALLGRLFGGALLTLGVILWFARDFRDEAAVRAVLLGALLGDVVNLVVATMGTLSGTSNALGWSTVVIYLYETLGSGHFLAARTSRLSPR